MLDFDPKSGGTRTTSAEQLLAHIRQHDLTLTWILDTHPHADHFSAAGYLHDVTGAPTATGARITDVQRLWRDVYDLPPNFRLDGSQWSRLFADGDRFLVGETEVTVMLSPGHTLSSVTYIAGDAAFIHDTMFMPDSGTARADFPGGDAHALWRSIQRILALPEHTRLFTGHDYRPGGRDPAWQTGIAAQQAGNAHVRVDEDAFIQLRKARDRGLPMPALILSALQVNIAGGRLPPPDGNGRRYLRIPLDAFPGAPWS